MRRRTNLRLVAASAVGSSGCLDNTPLSGSETPTPLPPVADGDWAMVGNSRRNDRRLSARTATPCERERGTENFVNSFCSVPFTTSSVLQHSEINRSMAIHQSRIVKSVLYFGSLMP